MRCTKVESRLTDYIDGLAKPRQREAIDKHLRQCRACREALEDVHAAAGALEMLGGVRAPTSFAPRVNSTVREMAPKALAPALFGRELRVAFSMGSLVLTVVVLWGWQAARTSPYVPRAEAPIVVPTVVAEAPAVTDDAEIRIAAIESPQPVAPTPRRASRRVATRSPRAARVRTVSLPVTEAVVPEPVDTQPVEVVPAPEPVTPEVAETIEFVDTDAAIYDMWGETATVFADGTLAPAAPPALERDIEPMLVSTQPVEPADADTGPDDDPAYVNDFLSDALELEDLFEV